MLLLFNHGANIRYIFEICKFYLKKVNVGGLYALMVVIDPDEMAGRGEGIPGNVEPAVAGEELIGELPGFEKIH